MSLKNTTTKPSRTPWKAPVVKPTIAKEPEPPKKPDPKPIPVNSKGEVLERVESKYMNAMLPTKQKTVTVNPKLLWKFPRISFDLWRQIIGFNKWAVDTYSAEAMLSLFIDKETGAIIPMVFHQQLKEGLSVSVDYTSDENIALMDSMRPHIVSPSLFHGSVHNHVKSGAFQSGTDVIDEKPNVGPHITLGNMDKDELSLHARINARFQHGDEPHQAFYVVETDTLIDVPMHEALNGMPPKAIQEIKGHMVKMNGEFDFPESWKGFCKEPAPAITSFSGYQVYGNYGLPDDQGEFDDWETPLVRQETLKKTLKGSFKDFSDAWEYDVRTFMTEFSDDECVSSSGGGHVLSVDADGAEMFECALIRGAVSAVMPNSTANEAAEFWLTTSQNAEIIKDVYGHWGLLGAGAQDTDQIQFMEALVKLCLFIGDCPAMTCPHPRGFLCPFFNSKKIDAILQDCSPDYSEMGEWQFFCRDFELICQRHQITFDDGVDFLRLKLNLKLTGE